MTAPLTAPVRITVGASVLRRAAELAGVRLPWPQAVSHPRLDGQPEGPTSVEVPEGLDQWCGSFVRPGSRVDLAVDVAHPRGPSRLCSWQRVDEDEVLSLTAASQDQAEVACFPRRLWTGELARLVTAPDRVEAALIVRVLSEGTAVGGTWVLDEGGWLPQVPLDGADTSVVTAAELVAQICAQVGAAT